MKNNLNRLHLFILLTIILCSAAGYLIGREDGRHERQAVEAQCDTDEDCYNKYGCGGYADPCEEEK